MRITTRLTRRVLFASFALAAMLLALVLAAPAAHATITGPCAATINGEDVAPRSTGPTSSPIEVAENAQVPVAMSAGQPLTHLKISLEFAGQRWVVRDEDTSGPTWTGSVNVADYAQYGVGLYKVIGESFGPSVSCSGEALVKVSGDPLSALAGKASVAATAVGVLGVAAASVSASRSASSQEETYDPEEQSFVKTFFGQLYKENCVFVLMQAFALTSLAMLGIVGTQTMAEGGAPARTRRRRRHSALRISIFGVVGGVLAGIGALVLLQEYGVIYPTQSVAIAGIAGGVAFGIVLPTLGRFFALRRANRRYVRMEGGR